MWLTPMYAIAVHEQVRSPKLSRRFDAYRTADLDPQQCISLLIQPFPQNIELHVGIFYRAVLFTAFPVET